MGSALDRGQLGPGFLKHLFSQKILSGNFQMRTNGGANVLGSVWPEAVFNETKV